MESLRQGDTEPHRFIRFRRIQIGKIINDAAVQKFYEFPHVQLVSPLRIARARKELGIGEEDLTEDLSMVEEIGREPQGQLLVAGSLKELGEKFILNASISDLEQESLLASLRLETGSEQEIIGGLIDTLCARFQRKIAAVYGFEIAPSHEIVGIGELTTTSLEAYAHFVRGFELYQSGDFDNGIDELAKATEEDEGFALAYSVSDSRSAVE